MRPSRPLRTIPNRTTEPRYALGALLSRLQLSPTELAAALGRSRAHVYRRLKDGVTWGEADDWAIHFGLFPWEVWPAWDEADPAEWADVYDEPTLSAPVEARQSGPLDAA
jgi:hypothetical protein